jgi:hypothetical protein
MADAVMRVEWNLGKRCDTGAMVLLVGGRPFCVAIQGGVDGWGICFTGANTSSQLRTDTVIPNCQSASSLLQTSLRVQRRFVDVNELYGRVSRQGCQ